MCGWSCDVIGRVSTHTWDHTSISAALDDLQPRLTVTHSVYVCMHRSACWSVDVSLFPLFEIECWWAHVHWLRQCFESDRLPAKKRLHAFQTYGNTQLFLCLARALPSSFVLNLNLRSSASLILPGASFSTVIVKKESVPKLANSEAILRFVLDGHGEEGICFKLANLRRFFLAPSTNIELIFGGSTLKTLLLKVFWCVTFFLACPDPSLRKVAGCSVRYWPRRSRMRRVQCIQNSFSQNCLILKNRFLVRMCSNFQERH